VLQLGIHFVGRLVSAGIAKSRLGRFVCGGGFGFPLFGVLVFRSEPVLLVMGCQFEQHFLP
jgi:hypothetical protein